MNTNYTLRKAELLDSTLLSEIGAVTFREAYAGMMSETDLQDYISKSFSSEEIINDLKDPNIFCLLVESEKKVIAYGKFQIGPPPVEVAHEKTGEIGRIYVRKFLYGTGLGERILNHFLVMAQNEHLSGVWLSVWQDNVRAIKFYEKNGFKIIGEQIFMVGSDPQKDFILFKTI